MSDERWFLNEKEGCMKPTKLMSQNQKILMWPWLAVIFVSLLISGGGTKQFLESTITPSPTSTLTLTPVFTYTPTSAPFITIKVISYNVLFGAGVERKYDDLLPPELRNKKRLPELLSLINQAKPDIMGIQEANGWNRGTPPIVQQVAEQLDMNYYLAEAPNDFNVVLFTKFQITEMENLSGKEGDPIFETMRALRATLLTPDNQSLNIFVVHFDPFSTQIRLCQLDTLIDELEPYGKQTTIVLGDMNFLVRSREYAKLSQAGWRHIAVATDVDQIWIPSAANWTSKPISTLESLAKGLSDHLPVGTELSNYPTWAGNSTSPSFPQFIPMAVIGCVL
jgi:endonuclease/exonuclease/phosphatase family metal-dependent hydrolase